MMQAKKVSTIATAVLMSLTVGCWQQSGTPIEDGDPVLNAKGKVINLEQGWTQETQQAYYFTNQGSRIMTYEWFLVMEQASSEQLFGSDDNINALRYLPTAPSEWNPDGLPVGFVKDVDQDQQAWLGMTCAACHTGQLEYNGTGIRIDGGQTLADVETFNRTLVEAMTATAQDEAKFARFSKEILGDKASPEAIRALRDNLHAQTEDYRQRNAANHATPMPAYGYGRVDAIGQIFNYVMVRLAGVPENARASDAPVSYPFLWGTHQSDVVQWTGFAPNGPAGIGALIRNGGEVLGVYGTMDIPDNKQTIEYASSLVIENLGKLEKWVAELRSPRWPSEYLPPLDAEKAQRGKGHYDTYCLSCHAVVARENEGLPYRSVLTPIDEVGTDPREYDNMVRLRKAGKFEGRKEAGLAGATIQPQTTALEPLINAVTGGLLAHPLETAKAVLIEGQGTLTAEKSNDGIGRDENSVPDRLDRHLQAFSDRFSNLKRNPLFNPAMPKAPKAYKARPLNGIWATPPYLHNGSVPNLYEILLPTEKRSQTFYVGSREFDPERVGYVTTEPPSGTPSSLLDTRLNGSTNVGHEYGTSELSEAERLDLLEYLKAL